MTTTNDPLNPTHRIAILTAAKAIRKHCIDCCGTAHEVRNCVVFDCALWPHRFGRRPNNIGITASTIMAERDKYYAELREQRAQHPRKYGTQKARTLEE